MNGGKSGVYMAFLLSLTSAITFYFYLRFYEKILILSLLSRTDPAEYFDCLVSLLSFEWMSVFLSVKGEKDFYFFLGI